MKKLLLAALTASLSLSVFGYDIFSYVSINGNAKSYTQTEYSVSTKFGDYFRTPVGKTTHTLNEAAKDVEVTEYTPRDVLVNKTQISFDASGKETGLVCVNADGETEYKEVYSYKNGQKSDVSSYGKDGSLEGKIIYAYEAGLMTEETAYDGDGVLIWKNVYKYEESKLSKKCRYFADGTLQEEENYKYSNTGAIESITTNNTSWGTKQEVFRYASNGQLSEIITYDDENKVCDRLVIKYDAQGNVAKVSDYSVAEKFGTTVNELGYLAEFTYTY